MAEPYWLPIALPIYGTLSTIFKNLNMILNSNFLGILILTCMIAELCADRTASKVLSRRKRYIAFPEGSSFSLAACTAEGVIGQPAPSTHPGTFLWGVNWGIAYELPNATETSRFYRRKNRLSKPAEQRRSRRELYGKLEKIMENMGYNGRECILKTLCESTQRLVPNGENMFEEMFRILFTLPMTKYLSSEPLEQATYDAAHRLGQDLSSCDKFTCPVSLVDLVQGYYNAPAPKIDTALNPWALFSSNFG